MLHSPFNLPMGDESMRPPSCCEPRLSSLTRSLAQLGLVCRAALRSPFRGPQPHVPSSTVPTLAYPFFLHFSHLRLLRCFHPSLPPPLACSKPGMSNKKQSWATAHSQLWTSPAARSAGSRTQSEVSSIASPNRDRSLLDDADGYEPPRSATSAHDSRQLTYQPKDKTLIQVSDILESYGAITCDSDIPSVLLHVVKELERTKRENNFKDLLLREYSGAVERRFGLYGEVTPPSVADVAAKLRDGAPSGAAAAPTPSWLEEPLNELRRTVRDSAFECFEKEVDLPAPVLLPDAQRTKANVSQLLQATCIELATVADAYAAARAAVATRLGNAADAPSRFRHLNLVEALAELEAQQELRAGAANEGDAAAPAGDAGAHTLRGALQGIIDVVPASLQIHFGLQVAEAPVLARCNHLTELVQFLLSEYLSMERYMEGVEAQRQQLAQVFRLPAPPEEGVDDDGDDDGDAAAGTVQLDDALSQSLRALQKTVTAVVTFPHHISEEEYALRRASTQAVQELAQLLVEARRGSSSSGGGGTVGGGALLGAAPVRVEPPTQNLLEMVELVKSRFATAVAQQQRRELAGAQGRMGQAHMEESMAKYGRQAMQLLGELATAQEDPTAGDTPSELVAEVMGAAELGRHLTPAKLDYFLSDVVERLRVVKTRHQRALHAAAANKARTEAALQKAAGLQKKLQRVAAVVEQIGSDALGLHFPQHQHNSTARDGDDDGGAKRAEDAEGGRGNGISALRRLNLRPTTDSAAAAAKPPAATTTGTAATGAGVGDAAAAAATVTEHNVVESLQLIAARLGTSPEVRDWAALREEVAQLRAGEARWKADTAAFHEAMAMLMQRLARNGQLVKQTLFLLGTDESPKDDLVEEVLRRCGDEDEDATADAAAANTVEYVERTLAELLQKYTRWAQRLQQTTGDHLYTQRKIVTYFAAVRRFFTSSQSRPTAPPEDIPEDNLYDIDSCLMRAADVILPALDAAIQAAAAAPAAHSTATTPPAPSSGTRDGQRQEALAHIARDAAAVAAGGVLPYDHRIARLYEGVTRLYTAVTSLMQVRYLSVPASTRRRSSGETELLFDGDADADANGFVDIDLDRLIRVSHPPRSDAARFSRQEAPPDASPAAGGAASATATPTPAPSPPPPSSGTVAANNDVILRVTYQNMEVLQDTLKRFSANHKMAAIVLQKDVDAMQQLLAGMLEVYSEVDMEGAFGQSRAALHDIYVTLRDRGQRQKGCYFFNRVGGEGSSPWVTALEHLAEGFRGVVGRLSQRTTAAAELRRIVDEVVDVCAMYLNWAEGCAMPATNPIPAELLALCVRDGGAPTAADGASTDAHETPPPPPSQQRPPRPSRTPPLAPRASHNHEQQPRSESTAGAAAKIACFTRDDAVTRVMAHMFQLAQLAVESPAGAAARAPGNADRPSAVTAAETAAATQRLREELQAARDAAAAAEQRVAELTATTAALEQTRNQAQSEAAVARAELRRWRRQQQQQEQPMRQEGQPPASATATVGAHAHSPAATLAAASDGVVMDEATVREVMAYMKTLSEELQAAKRRVSGSGSGVGRLRDDAEAAAAPPQHLGGARRRGSDVGDGRAYGGDGGGDCLDDGAYESDTGAPVAAAAAASASRRQRRHRTYAEVAEQLRHQYGATSLAPMVIVDPQPHAYRHSQRRHTPAYDDIGTDATGSAPPAASRYSPVKFHRPVYDACDRYYSRELAPAAWDAPYRPPAHAAAATTPATHTSQRHPPPPQPQRLLTRDAPLRQPAPGPAVAQRSTPVASATRRRPSLHPPPSPLAAVEESRDEHDEGYSAPSTPSVSLGAAARRRSLTAWAAAAPSPASIALTTAARHGHTLGAHHERTAAQPTHPSWPAVRDGRYDAGPASDGLAAAVRQIDAAAQRPTPTRRGSLASSTATAAPPASPEEKMSRHANLRATALRRLAEVVSQTTVPASRRSRY